MSVDEFVNQDSNLEAKIRARAHAIWEQEGRPAGRAELHWEQARREIEFESARSTTTEPPATSAAVSGPPRSRRRKVA